MPSDTVSFACHKLLDDMNDEREEHRWAVFVSSCIIENICTKIVMMSIGPWNENLFL